MSPAEQADQVTEWLHQIPGTQGWDHFATLTFRYDVPEARARSAFRRWLRGAARYHNAHFRFASVLGPRPGGRDLHFHALLQLHPQGLPLTVRFLDDLWTRTDRVAGFAHVRAYDRESGGEGYMARHSTPNGPAFRCGGLESNAACPRRPRCRRRNGCIYGPSWR